MRRYTRVYPLMLSYRNGSKGSCRTFAGPTCVVVAIEEGYICEVTGMVVLCTARNRDKKLDWDFSYNTIGSRRLPWLDLLVDHATFTPFA